MFKKIIFRGLSGAVLGVFIATFFALVSSTIYGKGDFSFVSIYLVKKCETEISAAWIMFLLSSLLGFSYGVTSLFFESEKLNLILQTLFHNLINGPVMFAIGWVCYWFPHTQSGIISWICIYLFIYILIWLCFYLNYNHKVIQINEKLKEL